MTRAANVLLVLGSLGVLAGIAGFLAHAAGGRDPLAGDSDTMEKAVLEARISGLERELGGTKAELAALKRQVGDLGSRRASRDPGADSRTAENRLPEDASPSARGAQPYVKDVLASIQDPVAALLEKLKSSDTRTRFEAIRELESLADKQKAIEIAKELLADSNPGVRMQALEALAKLDPQGALPILSEMAQDGEQSDWVRRRAIALLGESGDSSAVAAIQKAFDTGDRDLKHDAALALKRLGDDSLVQALIYEASRNLSNQDSALRAQSLSSIGSMRDPATIPTIVELMDDPNSNVRQEVAEALGDIGDASALPYLEKMAQDAVSSVRRQAERAIQRIKSPDRGGRRGGPGFFGGGGGGDRRGRGR